MKQNALEKLIAVGMSLFVGAGLLLTANLLSDGEQVQEVYAETQATTEMLPTYIRIGGGTNPTVTIPEGEYYSGDTIEAKVLLPVYWGPYPKLNGSWVGGGATYEYSATAFSKEAISEIKNHLSVSSSSSADVSVKEVTATGSKLQIVFQAKLNEGGKASVSYKIPEYYAGRNEWYGVTSATTDKYVIVIPMMHSFSLTWQDVTEPPTASLLGDADGSGAVGIRDAVALVKYLHNQPIPETFDSLNADMNCDGILNVIDLALLRRYLFSI